jgi:hypothetical protein
MNAIFLPRQAWDKHRESSKRRRFSQVQIDDYAHKAAAVVEAFLPALQAPALAAQLYGKTNRWGAHPCERKRTWLLSPFSYEKPDYFICQDRLGTTIIRKTPAQKGHSFVLAGKLPVTYYSGALPWNLTDMAVSTGVGRTYRYYSGACVLILDWL